MGGGIIAESAGALAKAASVSEGDTSGKGDDTAWSAQVDAAADMVFPDTNTSSNADQVVGK